MADFSIFIKTFNSYNSTFKECSFDDSNGIYICYDESQNIINFDKLVEGLYPNANNRPKSFDAIFEDDGKIYCIEFKNSKPSHIDNKEVSQKLNEGLNELFNQFSNLNIQKKDFEFYYCVVYQNCKEQIDRYKCGVEKNSILFGLKSYKDSVVKDIYTNSVDFFTKIFNKKMRRNLNC
jgi:hypothetical protein